LYHWSSLEVSSDFPDPAVPAINIAFIAIKETLCWIYLPFMNKNEYIRWFWRRMEY
jgi:hypothetical protein